ncbi:TPA: hypothetical protein HA246_06190 [Candidatus Woesearchaeota archaeon]|nr:hypothetical protein [Candidatus Woesearchaeota archaeon]
MAANSENIVHTRMCEYWHNLSGQQSAHSSLTDLQVHAIPTFFSDSTKKPEDFYVNIASGDKVLLQYRGMVRISDLAEFFVKRTFQAGDDIDLPAFYNDNNMKTLASEAAKFIAIADRSNRKSLESLLSESLPSGSSPNDVIVIYEHRASDRHFAVAQALCDKDGGSSSLTKACSDIGGKYVSEVHDKLFPIEAKKRKKEKEAEVHIPQVIGTIFFWVAVGFTWYYWSDVKPMASRAVSYAASFIPGKGQASQPGTDSGQPNSGTQVSSSNFGRDNQEDNVDPADMDALLKKYFGIIYAAGGMMPKQNFPESVVMINRRGVLKDLNGFYYAPLSEKQELADLFEGDKPSVLASRSFESTLESLFTQVFPARFAPTNLRYTVEAEGNSQAMYDFFYKQMLASGMTPEQAQEAALKAKAPFERLEQARFKTGMFSSSRIENYRRVRIYTPIADGYDTGNVRVAESYTVLHLFTVDNKWYILCTKPFYVALQKKVVEQEKRE